MCQKGVYMDNKYRDRCHCLLLYPDDNTHMEALRRIERSYDYAYILHDRDYTEDGEIKKPHYHVLVRFGQARWSSAICTELGIKENYIEKPRNFKNALLYLIHFNDSDKAQYDVNEVKGTLKTRLIQEISKVDKSECEKILEILDHIESYDGCLSMSTLSRHCASNGYWAEFRRSGAIFARVLDEHNLKHKISEESY